MSAISVGSFSDLKQFLQENSDAAFLCVRHTATDDVMPSVASVAAQASSARRPTVVLAPDGPSAKRWRRTLDAAGASGANVLSVRDAALAVVAGTDKTFARDARLLDANEMDILMEDLKVSGLKPGRLREMTRFFYKGIADGVANDPHWLISSEEQQVYALLVANLEARRAILDVEASAVALEALQTACGKKASATCVPQGAFVIAPDFGTLSVTTQRFIRTLTAKSTLVALGSSLDASNAEEEYPNPRGFAELFDSSKARCVSLQSQGTAPSSKEVIAKRPEQEFSAIVAEVQNALLSGTSPADITIACPNGTWMNYIASYLREGNVPCAIIDKPRKVKGDPREEARCGALRTRTLAKLLRDPSDFTALRSWLGLGDWLVRSDAFSKLIAYAQERNLNVSDAFKKLMEAPEYNESYKAIYAFEAPYARLAKLDKGLQSASGQEAVALIKEAGCALSEEQCTSLEQQARFDTETFARMILDAESDATKGDGADAVVITPYRYAFGRHGKLTIIAGMVSGFLPALDATSDKHTINHQRRAYDRDRLLFEAVKSTANDAIIFTRFTDDRIENADALSMEVSKIYLEGDARFASIVPSAYLTDNTPIPSLPTVETMVQGAATV